MIKLNKDSNSPKMERASAPGIKVKKYNIKGIITIEAALAIPLFLFAVICLIYLIEDAEYQTGNFIMHHRVRQKKR